MFERCRAFVIAANSVETRVLELTAHNLGFGEVTSRFGGSGATQSRAVITFFFIDYRLADEELLDVIEAVREERSSRLCFSPVILFTDDCPQPTTLKYVRFGFDDVIGLPLSRDTLAERLADQLDSELVYVEAKNYLGPDRRRLDHGAELRIGISSHTRVTFRRDVRHGIRVLQREERGHRFRPRPDASTHFMPKFFRSA